MKKYLATLLIFLYFAIYSIATVEVVAAIVWTSLTALMSVPLVHGYRMKAQAIEKAKDDARVAEVNAEIDQLGLPRVQPFPESGHDAIVATLPPSIRGDFEPTPHAPMPRTFDAGGRPVRTDAVRPYPGGMKAQLYYVQDATGVEVVSATVAPKKVGDVVAEFIQYPTRKAVRLRQGDETFGTGVADRDAELTFYRVPADDKLAKPVAHPVKEIQS